MVANFSVAGAVGLVGEIRILISLARHNMDAAPGSRARPDAIAKEAEALASTVDAVQLVLKLNDNLLVFMPCSHIAAAADRLRYWGTREDKRWDDLFNRACNLRDAIQTEFKDYLFYAYPKQKGEKLKMWQTEWAKILVAFPETGEDTFGAVDCYSLQHNTASVFHSMRVAEHGLRALAKERRLRLDKNRSVEWATWQQIISALDAEIKRIGNLKAGKARESALAFYSGARADLNGFKDEYRNAVMHVRATYDEFQALRALTMVHAFMERLAAKLSPSRARINWGRL